MELVNLSNATGFSGAGQFEQCFNFYFDFRSLVLGCPTECSHVIDKSYEFGSGPRKINGLETQGRIRLTSKLGALSTLAATVAATANANQGDHSSSPQIQAGAFLVF